jgi:V/A-type H+-transporting ATPase subunit I
MKRASVLFPLERRAEVLTALQVVGAVEVEQPDAASPGDPAPGEASGRVERLTQVLSYIDRHVPEKKSLIESFVTLRREVSGAEVTRALDQLDLDRIAPEAMGDEVRRAQIGSRLVEIAREEELLGPWRDLPVPLADVDDTLRTAIRAYVIPGFGAEAAQELLRDHPVFFQAIAADRHRIWAVAAWPHGEPGIEDALLAMGGHRVAFGRFAGLPAQELLLLGDERHALEDELRALDVRARLLAQHRPPLRAMYDHYQAVLEREQVGMARTDRVGVITGWIPAAEVERLHAAMGQLDAVASIVEDPSPGDVPPILLDNPSWLRPFEVVTTLYGYPRPEEVDPTPLLAPFFLVFFGLALADAGYGLAVFALAYLMIRRLKLRPGEDRLPRLLMLGGISAMFFGTLGGSWFGDGLNLLPDWAPVRFAREVLALLDPVAEPVVVLLIALGLGLLQVWVGIAAKAAMEVRAGNRIGALWDQVPWLIFLPSLAAMLAGDALGPAVAETAPRLAMLGAVLLALAGARRQRNWLLKPFSGFMNVYPVMGYLGDVLSYSRLLALGLASTVIGIVVNQVALLVRDIPMVGIVVAVMVMAVGHTFNLLVSTLGSFVHAGRLQFVEFFTKFFEGGGRAFRPLRREGRYTVVRG